MIKIFPLQISDLETRNVNPIGKMYVSERHQRNVLKYWDLYTSNIRFNDPILSNWYIDLKSFHEFRKW